MNLKHELASFFEKYLSYKTTVLLSFKFANIKFSVSIIFKNNEEID